jgi:predicted dehydrogenase
MQNKIGIGVVGAGAIGIRGALMHLSQPDVHDRIHLAAICDPVPGRAEAAAEKFQAAAAYESYEALLNDTNVDAVTICSPIGFHYQQGLQAIEAEKHIHFNKTMTTSVAEATDLMEKAKKKNLWIVPSPGMMLHPHNQRIRRLILEQSLGTLAWAITGTAGVGDYHMKEEFRNGDDILSTVNPAWYYQKPGGGPQYDITVYCLHTLTGILGPAKRVMAMSGLQIPQRFYQGKQIQCSMDDTTMLLIDFGNSLFTIVYAAVAGTITQGFQPNIYGTRGSIIGTSFGESPLQYPADRQPHVTTLHARMAESHVFADMMQLVDCIQTGKASIVSVDHARHVIDIIESGYRAAETGITQELSTSFSALPIDQLVDL